MYKFLVSVTFTGGNKTRSFYLHCKTNLIYEIQVNRKKNYKVQCSTRSTTGWLSSKTFLACVKSDRFICMK